ncbi:hypothetical protein, partial [Roseinatronobacter ekhonensis]|uniref:hypothetical protein n=1 Tax=Roseinatronobacter ekhonensis TaxID=254356 RepID=UPI001C7CF970
PQISQDLSCAAANAQSLTGKARAPGLERLFLRSQTSVFPQNRRIPEVRRRSECNWDPLR